MSRLEQAFFGRDNTLTPHVKFRFNVGKEMKALREWGSAQPMTARCGKCGESEQCTSLTEEHVWWALHECGVTQ